MHYAKKKEPMTINTDETTHTENYTADDNRSPADAPARELGNSIRQSLDEAISEEKAKIEDTASERRQHIEAKRTGELADEQNEESERSSKEKNLENSESADNKKPATAPGWMTQNTFNTLPRDVQLAI
jgi:hypothetical protein